MDNFEFDFDDLMTSDAEYVDVANQADVDRDLEEYYLDLAEYEYEMQLQDFRERQMEMGW